MTTQESVDAAQAVGVDRAMLDKAVGGWRGMIDSGVPPIVFVVAYLVTGQELNPSLVAAVVSGAILAVVRLARRESLSQVLGGFLGVALSAFFASRTGRAEDFFALGLLINIAYGGAFLVSILVRWPLIGVIVNAMRGDSSGWRSDPAMMAAARTTSWLWVAMFGLRLAVQLPLYLVGAIGPLSVAKILLGWPLFLLTAFLTYRIMHPVIHAADAARAAEAARAAGDQAAAGGSSS